MSKKSKNPANSAPIPFERFLEKKSYDRYEDKRDYLEAISAQITPDLWTAIVVRSVQDAVFGKPNERAKAREWLGRHVLPDRKENELIRSRNLEHESTGNLLVSIFDILRNSHTPFGADREEKKQGVVKGLALLLRHFTEEERSTLQEALVHSDSKEVRALLEKINEALETDDLEE